MVSALYICHWPDRELEYSRCEVLLHRSYHNDVPSEGMVISSFSEVYLRTPPHERGPFLYNKGVTYISLWGSNDILLLAVARRNVNAMSTITLLGQIQALILHYFDLKAVETEKSRRAVNSHANTLGLTRDAVVDNHALVFELLDECVDFGLVQVTDFNILKEYIKTEFNAGNSNHSNIEYSGDFSDSGSDSDSASNSKSSKSKRKSKFGSRSQKSLDIKSTHNQAVRTDVVNDAAANFINSSIVRTQVSAISWRPKGIFYPKNEIYIDIIEECEFLYDLESQKVRTNEVSGVCMVRSYLSGMPVCKLGLNEQYISRVDNDSRDLHTEDNGLKAIEANPEDPEISKVEPESREGNLLAHAEDEEDPQEVPLIPGSNSPNPAAAKLIKVPITNVQFHSCVELSKVYEENLIFFTPPDDEFRLFSYSVEQQRRKQTKPILLMQPTYKVMPGSNKLQIMCTITTNFRKKLHCNKVIVKIPVNPKLFRLDNSKEDNFRFKCEMGEVRFSVDSSQIFWAIGDLPGSKKMVRLMAEVSLLEGQISQESIVSEISGKPNNACTTEKHTGLAAENENQNNTRDFSRGDNSNEPDSTISELDKYYGVGNASSSVFGQLSQNGSRVPHEVTVSFEMPMFTYSGLKVTYLRVDEDTMKYTCFPWVRYSTSAGSGPEKANFRFKLGPSNFIFA